MKLMQIFEFIRYLENDGVYGNTFFSQEIIKHELRILGKNAFFLKGLQKYVVDENFPFLKFCFDFDDFEIHKQEMEKYLSELQQGKNEGENAFEYIKEKKQKVNHTENLVLLFFFVGLETVDREGEKIQCCERKSQETGKNRLVQCDCNFHVEMDKVKGFLFSKKLPLPDSLFPNENNILSNDFLNSLETGPWQQEFSIESLQDFVRKNLPENYQEKIDKYEFFEDGDQFCIAFGKERAKVKKSKGLKAIHVLLKSFMDAEKDHKLGKRVKSTEIERLIDSKYAQVTTDNNIIREIQEGKLSDTDESYSQFDYNEIISTQKKIEQLEKQKEITKNENKPMFDEKIKVLKEYLKKNTRPGKKERGKKEPGYKVKIKSPETVANHNVMRNIQYARKNMVEKHSLALLESHLQKSIDNNNGIIYSPDPNSRYHWILEPPKTK